MVTEPSSRACRYAGTVAACRVDAETSNWAYRLLASNDTFYAVDPTERDRLIGCTRRAIDSPPPAGMIGREC